MYISRVAAITLLSMKRNSCNRSPDTERSQVYDEFSYDESKLTENQDFSIFVILTLLIFQQIMLFL